MYLAENPDVNDLEEYFLKYAPIVKSAFHSMLAGRAIEMPVKNSSDLFKVWVKPASEVGDFLRKYSEDAQLRRLLIGDFNTLLDILDEIKSIDGRCKFPISKTKYHFDGRAPYFYIANDLNVIFKMIFVNEIYEDNKVFDKHRLAEMKKMSVCPYCGEMPVKPYKNDRGNILGYQIEHYLPKSIYPFFAISFFNLFPACGDCNDIQQKGTKSPLADNDRTQCLMHPHAFDNDAMRFDISYNGLGEFDPKNSGIFIDFRGSKELKRGYTEVIPIENRYKAKTEEVQILWNRIASRNDDYQEYAIAYGVSREDFITPEKILGFEKNLENSRKIEKYKFQTDTLSRLLKNLKD